VPHVRASDFEIYKIPVPLLEEQDRIVTILDKFDILTTSISEGLPKEIELRKKQYEYYRDLLLTFPTINVDEKK
jgi:type I restriction enzyme S subunit